MIEVSHLTKKYGDHIAVRDISFTIEKGEIVGFLGPNGAGKSTTMNILTGYLSPTEGDISIAGFDILNQPIEAKKHIGYLPEIPPLYTDMTVMEFLNFVYSLKKCKLQKKPHLEEICRLVKIQDVSKRLIRNLSKGYRQRVGIAQALVGNPEVLILDEPTVGLDPKQIIEIRNLIKELANNHTIVLSSHILQEIQAVCKRIIIINRGYLVADGTQESLAKSINGDRRLVVRVTGGSEEKIMQILHMASGVKRVTPLGPKEVESFDFEIEGKEGIDIRKSVFAEIMHNNMTILGMKGAEMTLEEIFLQLTDGSKDIKPIINSTPVKRVLKSELSKETSNNVDHLDEQEALKEESK